MLFRLIVLLVVLVCSLSFVPVKNNGICRIKPINSLIIDEPPKKSFWLELRDMFFSALPEAFSGDESKKIQLKNFANIKEGSFSKHKIHSHWKNDDIIANFASHYIPNYTEATKTQKLFNKLEQLEENDLLESLDEYMNILKSEKEVDPLTASEVFIAESLQYAVRPMDTPMDTSKVRKDPQRFFKPVKSTKLYKVLAKDPDYFHH